MEPWYKVAISRKEVRAGRSFNPDEFAIALEQVLRGTALEDYSDPDKFFARTYFTRAWREHTGMVLLVGATADRLDVIDLKTDARAGRGHVPRVRLPGPRIRQATSGL